MKILNDIKIGTWSKTELLNRLQESKIQFNPYAIKLFDNKAFDTGGMEDKLSLVQITPEELGIQNPYSLEMVIKRGENFGLRPCPLITGAYLRLEYMNQVPGPYLTIVSMRPSSDENEPTGFYLRNFENALWLRGYRAIGECDHPVQNEFIFLK